MTTAAVPAGRFRPTIAFRITAMVVLAILLLTGLGIMTITSITSLRAQADEQATLNGANAQLIDLDLQQSMASLALSWGLLATTEAEGTTANNLMTSVVEKIETDLSELTAVTLPTALSSPLAEVVSGYRDYLTAVQEKMTTAVKLDPASAAAKALIAEDTAASDALGEKLAAMRQQLAEAVAAGDEAAAERATGVRVMVVVTLIVAAVVLGGIGWFLVRGIRSALTGLRTRMEDIAEGEGDLTARLPETARDETGDVARAVNRFISRVQTLVQEMANAAETLGGSVHTLSAMTTEMSANAGETNGQASAASDAAEDVSRNISTLSAGSEQMTASIREIAQSAAEAAQVANTAVNIAATARGTVTALADSSSEIENVVALITSIAEQTNLLALNATIEAARAGESGKGFAVVAGEVKELAQETAKATEDITQRVAAIQSGTTAAVDAISTIGEIVTKISDYSTTIASAVEEQTATTNEMSRNVSEAASGANLIAGNISQVAGGASSTSEAAAEAARTTSTVSTVVENLRTTVGTFRY
ncbi:methyl-accepting chemotaxis protein [Actinoplanes sp. NBRC 101535]|uniref:methyl-accepting chemotaxis protein n=1 Tax=Actinoplanes sp. NBRC 101535 TaxID=3032196 RepID=UPI00255418E4|nr:methyl-accepting chemotaxis protein [Actinoplanes sp. NBRC 101535]